MFPDGGEGEVGSCFIDDEADGEEGQDWSSVEAAVTSLPSKYDIKTLVDACKGELRIDDERFAVANNNRKSHST